MTEPLSGQQLVSLINYLIEKGRREEALKIARNLLQSGIDRSTVMQVTGLSEVELAQIRH